jgi:hypothetical protein
MQQWQNSSWGSRLYVVSSSGLYRGNKLLVKPEQDGSLNWWTFKGLIATLLHGAEAQLK